jgi:hypothetical protein
MGTGPSRASGRPASSPAMKHPERGEIWIKRQTSERVEVWTVNQRWVTIYPQRSGNRRPVDVITHNFLQEFLPADEQDG